MKKTSTSTFVGTHHTPTSDHTTAAKLTHVRCNVSRPKIPRALARKMMALGFGAAWLPPHHKGALNTASCQSTCFTAFRSRDSHTAVHRCP